MTDLLDAIDALTLPTRTKVPQDIVQADGKERSKIATIEHPPLLNQLEDAIRGVMDGTAGANASTASTRSVINSDALYQFMLIANHIREWCRLQGIEPRPHPADGLRAWYVAHLTRVDVEERWHTSQLRSWASTIRAIVNPARTMELTAACPICEADTWTDTEGTTYRHPIRIEYHDGGADILRTARALCRACDRVWRGSTELRELRWEVDHADTPIPPTTDTAA